MLCSTRNLSNTTALQQATAQLGTDQATPNTQVKRDASGGFSVATLAASSIESTGTTLNIATANNTQTVNLGSGTGVQTINVGNSGVGATAINVGGATDTVNIVRANFSNSIAFPNAEARKRISLFDEGTPSDQTDHRFNGLGKGFFTQVYQIKATAENHSFCAATSATTSNELLRIAGTGAVTCGGSFTAGTITTGSITSTSGAAITGAVTVASGGITVQNGVSCSAITTPYVIFPSGTLSYYEEYDHLTTFNLATVTTSNVTIRFTRIGRHVTAHFPLLSIVNVATLSNGPALVTTVAFPTRFRSSSPCIAFVSVNNDSVSPVSSLGCATITAAGIIEIRPTTTVSSFSIGPSYNFGFSSFTATWTV
jgi:hypothetical protein